MVTTWGCDPSTLTDPADIADSMFQALVSSGTLWDPSTYSHLYTVGPFLATFMSPSGPQTALGTDFENGSNTGTLPLPNNTAVLVQKRTPTGGRRGRGRAYFPPLFPTEGAVSAIGDIDGVARISWQTSMDAFLDNCETNGIPLYLLHDDQPSSLLPSLITSLTVAPKVATQRTRLRP